MSNRIFAFTPTHGNRDFLRETVRVMRVKAGIDFDWGVWGGRLGPAAMETAEDLLRSGQIQLLTLWPENRGQHHAMAEALTHARKEGYDWLLRIDDDVRARTKRWLAKMVDRLNDLQVRAKDVRRRLIAAPRIVRLNNPLQSIGTLDLGQPYPTDLMDLLGGMVRLHPVSILDGFIPSVYAPKGRRDPEQIREHIIKMGGMQVRFPDIRCVHNTTRNEAADDDFAALERRMGYYWPYLASEDTDAR